MKILNWLAALMLCTLIGACGGGGEDAGTPPFGGSACSSGSSASGASGNTCPAPAAAIDVVTSLVLVPSGGGSATIAAVVKDAGNVALASAPVRFSADSGTLTSASSVTDSTGTATAVFSPGADRSNRSVTVTVTSGAAVGTVHLQVVGTTLTLAPSGSTSIPLGGSVPVNVTATDSNNAVIPGLTIAVSSKLGNGLSATSVVTDASGLASVGYTATTGAGSSDTLTFDGGGATAALTVNITP